MCPFPNKNCHFALCVQPSKRMPVRPPEAQKGPVLCHLRDEFPTRSNPLRLRKLLRPLSLRCMCAFLALFPRNRPFRLPFHSRSVLRFSFFTLIRPFTLPFHSRSRHRRFRN